MDFSTLGTTEWLIIAGVVLLIIVVIVAVMASRRRRRQTLQQRYGPEYERTVRARGGERAARADLTEREKEHERLDLRDLSRDERHRFAARMAVLQYRFAEDPAGAVYESGRVAADALQARGYPIANDRDLALRLLAVDHPREAQPLRTAIEGTYGKDPGRLRETFVGVRDGLREALAVHYTYEDGVEGSGADSSSRPTTSRARSGPAAAAAPALAATGSGSDSDVDRTRDDRGVTSQDRTAGGLHAAPGEADASHDEADHDRTVRLDDQSEHTDHGDEGAHAPPDPGADDQPADEPPPVGAVPPPPGEGGAPRR